jgi:outer membrane biosynthesis protein TonB
MMLLVFLAFLLQSTRTEVTPPSVISVEAPLSPYGAVQGGVALADLTISSSGNVERAQLLDGAVPFSDEALRVVPSWHFNPARSDGRPVVSHVGVLTLFRPAAMVNFGATLGVGGPSFGFHAPAPGKSDHSAFPQSISDPGYPQNSIAWGTVVLEVTIDKAGHPTDIRVIQDVPSLTENSKSAVRNWRYLPAVDSGESVDGKVIVAIAYLSPVGSGPVPTPH